MLKYEINIKDVFTDKLRIDYSHFQVEDIDFIDEEKTLVTCFYNEDIDIKANDFIVAVFDDSVKDEENFVTTHSKIKEYEVQNVDTDERFFTVISDKYCELKASYMSKETLQEYEDDIIGVAEYNGKTEEEKSYYKENEYEWKPVGISGDASVITNSVYETLEEGYGKDSYSECYRKTDEDNFVIPYWVYEGLDDEEKSSYVRYSGHMVLSPFVKQYITYDEYEQLFDYEKSCYQISSYIYVNGKTIENEYLYVWFKERHFFKIDELITPSIFIECEDEEGEVRFIELPDGEVINEYGLRFVRSELTDKVYEFISKSQEYKQIEYYDTDGEIIRVNNSGYLIARLDTTRVLRYDIIFQPNIESGDTNTTLFLKKHLTSISVPLQQKFSTDMYQDDIIKEKFIDVETKKAINEYVEMEKDVYHPVILKDGEFIDIKEIRFNLHFREHRGNDWVAEPFSYWNGTHVENGEIVLMNKCNYDDYGYYSYNNVDKQSDLLSYLNFTNNDVKYQKNVIKKSFLRLAFYDSPRNTDQHLLQFSTIFMDYGKLYGKYGRNFVRPGVYNCLPLTSEDGSTKHNLDGIRVDREPFIVGVGDDKIEEYRLSSQFSVKDKYSSQGSSDGFYLYLWKDNDLGFTPSDIYLKVEFNHAGYGRTIPFMLPFKTSGGIKSFQDILDDWNKKDGSDGEYGIRRYIKYSYIHFKYKYDKERQRHVYYLDNDQYGDVTLEKGNVLNINLYEAKVV